MAKLKGIYKCNVCGNVIEVLHAGGGTLVCCEEHMHLIDTDNKDEGAEKHLPVVVIDDNIVQIQVGEVAHPMEDEHYVEWIELSCNGVSQKKFLLPGDKPVAEFCVGNMNEYSVRAYCNQHGMWKK